MKNKNIKVGVWAIIIKDSKILLWKRNNSHWDWDFAFPWWHLEFWESFEECVSREVKEEVWIKVENIRFWNLTNDVFEKEWKHYITVFMLCNYKSWEVKNMEPEKNEWWNWIKWEDLPENSFLPIKNLLKTWYNPFN